MRFEVGSTYLEVLHDDRVVAVLALDDLRQVLAHFLQFTGEGAQTVHLGDDFLGQLALGRVLDVTHQVLHTDFFLWRCLDGRWHVDELATDVAVVVDLLLREVSLSRKTNLRLLVHTNDTEDRRRVVASEHLVDINIVSADRGTS